MVNRRDFLKLAGLASEIALLWGCRPKDLPTRQQYDQSMEGLPDPNFNLLPNLQMDTVFSHERPLPNEVVEFGRGGREYRVLHLPIEDLIRSIYNPEHEAINPTQRSTELALKSSLSAYESVLCIERKKTNAYGLEEWERLAVPGTIEQRLLLANSNSGEVPTFASWLKPELADQTTPAAPNSPYSRLDTSLNALQTINMDPQLPEADLRFIATQLLRPENVEPFINHVMAQRGNGNALDDIPESLPKEFMADVYAAIYTPQDPSDLEVLSRLTESQPFSTCIFVPKLNPEVAKAKEHIVKKEFIPLPDMPSICVVEDLTSSESVQKIIVTHKPTQPLSDYNYGIAYGHSPLDIVNDPNAWELVDNPQSNTGIELLMIHNIHVEPNPAQKVWRLKPEYLQTFLIPNKFRGNPKMDRNEVNNRLATGILLPNPTGLVEDQQVLLFGDNVMDLVQPVKKMYLNFENWITDVSAVCNEARASASTHVSKIGIATTQALFERFFRGVSQSGEIFISEAVAPQNRMLRELFMSTLYLDRLNDGKKMKDFNWLAGVSTPLPVYELRGTNIAAAWQWLGEKMSVDMLKDKITLDPLVDPLSGAACFLNPGEMLPFGEIVEIDHVHYILLGLPNRNDSGGVLNAAVNNLFVDGFDHVFAVKLEDAFHSATAYDPDNNILDGIKAITKYAAIAAGLYYTIVSPTLLPNLFMKGSVFTSSRIKMVSNFLLNKGGDALRRALEIATSLIH